MVEELRLWAINVDEFRQCFAAPPALAQTLIGITDSLIPADTSGSHTLLSKLGPLLRRPIDAPIIRPMVPTRVDAEAMMTSRYIAADRLGACWVLARSWLDHLSSARTTLPLAQANINELEFDLVRVGVPTELSIRQLWRRTVGISLRPTDDMSIGYTPYTAVVEMAAQWEKALPELEASSIDFATGMVAFLSGFPQYAEGASLDLIAWWTAR